MKFGVNTFVWVSPSTTRAVVELAPKVKSMGFDILEIACETPELLDPPTIKVALEERIDASPHREAVTAQWQ